ncbi:MAG: UDP-2,3-diacylglucosamine diphosphatase [Fidelibacterota bacterium]|nr:MAG: UDP-2,3-diacylglucosamine diphosphatase [Candidatus Neomarinimicrobiota bacterium]
MSSSRGFGAADIATYQYGDESTLIFSLPIRHPLCGFNSFLLILRCLSDGQRLISPPMTAPAYFISDVHLSLNDGDQEQERRQHLYRFFDMVRHTGGTLFLVGDFFDFWFEYNHVIPKRYFDVISHLYQLHNSGVEIHFILGNHDYWTNDFLNGPMGMHVYPAEAVVDIDGQRIHLTHGDGLLARDTGYRLMRKILRSRITVFLFRWLHPDLGITLAQSASRISRKYNPPEGFDETRIEELSRYAAARWDEGCDMVVMGHYHLNRLHTTNEGKSFLLLGDWIYHYTYGKLEQGRLTLETWPT